MLDKISPGQFQFIYREITGDQSKAPTSEQEKYDERIRCIIKNADKTLARDLQISNGKKTKFDKFWDIAKDVIEELTVVNDRCHAHGSTSSGELVVNMAVAISARDLYEKCKVSYLSKELPESEIPSFSWFEFQFWPKDLTTHSARNYTVCFPVSICFSKEC